MTESNEKTEKSKAIPTSLLVLYPNLDDRLEKYMRLLCYANIDKGPTKCDLALLEYFGVFSLTDVRAPRRKLWYIYYSRADEIDNTVDRIHKKYGKKNMYELIRKPICSGADLRTSVEKHFGRLKWRVKGNLLEAPPQSAYTDEKVIKMITDVYNAERRIYYEFLNERNDRLNLWNKFFST